MQYSYKRTTTTSIIVIIKVVLNYKIVVYGQGFIDLEIRRKRLSVNVVLKKVISGWFLVSVVFLQGGL